jgi:phosphatidyl-myo-inositol alpha-mannosyltransferase
MKNVNLSVALVFDDTLDSSDAVAQYLKTVGAWLSSQGHKVSYLVGETKLTQWAGGPVYSLAKNQTVYFNGNKLSMPVAADVKQLRQVLDQEKFDVLHVMMPYSPIMAQRVINAAGADTAIVGTFHIYPSGVLSNVGSHLLRRIYGKSLSKFGAVASVSSAAAGFAKQAYGLDSQIIPNPVDVQKFAAAKQSQKNRIVFLGRLVKRKGCRELIEAFALLSGRLPEAKLVIAGDGPARQALEKLVSRLGISDKVEFAGFIDEADKPGLLASAAVACFPSLYGESFGIVLIEAMAAGAGVVVGGDNPGYRSVLGQQPVLLFNPRDKDSFAAKLQEFLEDDKLRRQLHDWQQVQVKQYDINVVGKQLLELYETAIARLNKTRHNKTHG